MAETPLTYVIYRDPLQPPSYGLVYLIRCSKNGKAYVGQTTKTVFSRWNQHLRSGKCRLLARAIAKFGPEAFEVAVLDYAEDLDELNSLENFWVSELGSVAPGGYNLMEGGGSAGKRSDATRHLMREAAKERGISSKTIEAARVSNTGRVHSPDTVEKNRQAHTGRKQAASHVENNRLARIGKAHSEERKRNISLALRASHARRRGRA